MIIRKSAARLAAHRKRLVHVSTPTVNNGSTLYGMSDRDKKKVSKTYNAEEALVRLQRNRSLRDARRRAQVPDPAPRSPLTRRNQVAPVLAATGPVEKAYVGGGKFISASKMTKPALREAVLGATKGKDSYRAARGVSPEHKLFRDMMSSRSAKIMTGGGKNKNIGGVNLKNKHSVLPNAMGAGAYTTKTGGKRAPATITMGRGGSASRRRGFYVHEMAHATPKRSGYRIGHQIKNDPAKLGREEARAEWARGVDYKGPRPRPNQRSAYDEAARTMRIEGTPLFPDERFTAAYRHQQDTFRRLHQQGRGVSGNKVRINMGDNKRIPRNAKGEKIKNVVRRSNQPYFVGGAAGGVGGAVYLDERKRQMMSKALGDWKTIDQREREMIRARKRQRQGGGLAVAGLGAAAAGVYNGQGPRITRAYSSVVNAGRNLKRVPSRNGVKMAARGLGKELAANPYGTVGLGAAAAGTGGAAHWGVNRGIERYHQGRVNDRRKAYHAARRKRQGVSKAFGRGIVRNVARMGGAVRPPASSTVVSPRSLKPKLPGVKPRNQGLRRIGA